MKANVLKYTCQDRGSNPRRAAVMAPESDALATTPTTPQNKLDSKTTDTRF